MLLPCVHLVNSWAPFTVQLKCPPFLIPYPQSQSSQFPLHYQESLVVPFSSMAFSTVCDYVHL